MILLYLEGDTPHIKLPYKKVTNSASAIALVSRLIMPLKNKNVTNPYINPDLPQYGMPFLQISSQGFLFLDKLLAITL